MPNDWAWYYAKDGERLGPVPEFKLRQMHARGEVAGTDLVWSEGMAGWEPLAGALPPEDFARPVTPPVATPMSPGNVTGESTSASLPNRTAEAPEALGYYRTIADPLVEYRGFLMRAPGFLLDGLVVSAGRFILLIPVGMGIRLAMGGTTTTLSGTAGRNTSDVAELVGGLIVWAVFIVVPWLYEALMTASRMQGTLGKMAIGAKVVRTGGGRVTFARASGRHFAKYLSYILLVGFIMAAFTRKKQGLHDFICDTVVVKK